MAGYNYSYKGYYTHQPQTDDWSQMTYESDHVCRPVIVDAEGRKRPIIAYTHNPSTECHVVSTTVVQQGIHSPLASESPYGGTPGTQRAYDGYGGFEDRRRTKPLASSYDRPQTVEEFVPKVQNEASRPRINVNAANWRQNTKPLAHNGNTGDDISQKSSAYKNYEKNDDYEYEHGGSMGPSRARPSHATRPSQTGNLSQPTNDINEAIWHLQEAAKPIKQVVEGVGYGKEAAKPSVTTTTTHSQWYTSPDTMHYKPTNNINDYLKDAAKTAVITALNSKPPTTAKTDVGTLSKPTNNMNEAMGYLEEAAKPTMESVWYMKETNNSSVPTSPYSSWSTPYDAMPSKPPVAAAPRFRYEEPAYTETIDSEEASRRYGKYSSSYPYIAENKYAPTIDSKEAARRYRGAKVGTPYPEKQLRL